MSEVAWWQGEFGNEYTMRNAYADIEARCALWRDILELIPDNPLEILEIGAGSGNNLRALYRFGYDRLVGIEPNEKARKFLSSYGFKAHDGTAENPGRTADLVFTSGVLIHIPPEDLLKSCQGIYDAAERYIVCIEYFSDEPEEKLYRGHSGKLWKRDFGSYWMDNFDLTPLGYGFVWKKMTGLDNLTYWVFRK